MLVNRVTKRKRGYERKKPWVRFPYTNPEAMELVEKRTEEGYLLGWTVQPNGRKVYLRYRQNGTRCRSVRKRRSKPSRKRSADARKRWGANGERGRYRMQTTKGRKTQLEAREEGVGGILYRWVR